ncbi:MAG: hypothetical protein ABII12_13100 [Planctomycetota bacterium]|nr:hypothetical protein [Planctomycetota bacterium]
MAVFGAQGIRDAMTKSYHKHVRNLTGQALPEDTSLHEAGLYGALATRYKAGFKSMPEVAVWSELAPFVHLPPDEGLAALAEYVVYKEMPAKADRPALSAQIRRGWSLLDQDERESMEAMAEINGFPWLLLL